MEPNAASPLTQIKDVIVAIAAIVTSGAAVAALFRWRAETIWRDNRELARSIVRACLRVRDGFGYVRNPLILPAEFPDDPPVHPVQDAEDRYQQNVHVYQNRINQLNDGMQELETAVLEAEALWGSEIEDLMRKVRRCRTDLVYLLQDYLSNINSGHTELRDDRERWEKVQAGVHASRADDDELSEQIRSALDALLALAEKHLKR